MQLAKRLLSLLCSITLAVFTQNVSANTIEYEDSCDTKNGTCVEAFVKNIITGAGHNINVQQLQGAELAKIYTGDNTLDCEIDARKSNNDDYISCTSQHTGAKYEFRFDDLYESLGADIQQSIGAYICDKCGGEYNNKNKDLCIGISSPQCSNKYLSRFGYSVSSCTSTGCEYRFPRLKSLSVYKNAQGETIINGDVFSNTQIRLTTEVPELLEQYSMVMLSAHGLALESFRCNKSFYKYGNDDVIRCYVKSFGDNHAQAVDFLFDDLHELSENEARAGRAGLTCNASGGSSDGETCLGMTEQMCSDLAQRENIKTKWDMSQGGCVLVDAQEQKQRKQTLGAVANTALIIAGVAAAIPTGGATLVVVLSATAASVIGGKIAKSAVADMNTYYTDVLYNASNCWMESCSDNRLPLASCRICAYNNVTNFITKVALYEGHLDPQRVTGMSLIIDKLSEALKGTLLPFCMRGQTVTESNSLTRMATAGNVLAATGAIVSLSGGLSAVQTSAKLTQAANALRTTKTISNLSRWLKNVDDILTTESRTINALRSFATQARANYSKATKVDKLVATLDKMTSNDSINSSELSKELYDGIAQICETDFCKPTMSISEFVQMLEYDNASVCGNI